MSNIPDSIKSKIGAALHNKVNHPISIVKNKIYHYFSTSGIQFKTFDQLDCHVSTKDNFDSLLIPPQHPSRSKSDTYYVDDETVLRTHTSAHQYQLLQQGCESFLVTGDVYRKDEIDCRHYPVFHQMEGLHLVDISLDMEIQLKHVLTGLAEYLFPNRKYRFNNDYFPFTNPSFEMEVQFGNQWLEILGCGVIHNQILESLNIHKTGWAFGLGLERIAMILFDIPDIRLFWSTDSRFINQFKNDEIIQFKPYSKIESLTKDISFWIPENEINKIEGGFEWLDVNSFYELVREICGDSIESVIIYDQFYHQKHQKYSMTFRLLIGAIDNKEIDHANVTRHANECIKNIVDVLKQGYSIR